MSKTTSKKVAKKAATTKKAPVKKTVKKAAPVQKAQASQTVQINKNLLMFLVLTLILAAVMLVIQAQTNNVNNEQSKAQQALENETTIKSDTKQEGMKNSQDQQKLAQ